MDAFTFIVLPWFSSENMFYSLLFTKINISNNNIIIIMNPWETLTSIDANIVDWRYDRVEGISLSLSIILVFLFIFLLHTKFLDTFDTCSTVAYLDPDLCLWYIYYLEIASEGEKRKKKPVEPIVTVTKSASQWLFNSDLFDLNSFLLRVMSFFPSSSSWHGFLDFDTFLSVVEGDEHGVLVAR